MILANLEKLEYHQPRVYKPSLELASVIVQECHSLPGRQMQRM